MHTETFYILDADYIVESGRAVVRLFGRTKEGKSIVVFDDSFEPYFYVLFSGDKARIQNELQTLVVSSNGETVSVKKVELVTKRVGLKEQEVFKVTAFLPRNVPALQEASRGIPGIDEPREYDILFYKRYLFDRQLTPLTWTDVKGTQIQKEGYSADILLHCSSIGQSHETQEIKPKLLAFDLETVQKQGKNHVIMASLMTNAGLQKVLVYEKDTFQHSQLVANEKALIETLAAIVRKEDPDILLTYNGDAFDLAVLHERSKDLKINLVLGRTDDIVSFKKKGRVTEANVIGRPHIDIFSFISRLMRPAFSSEVMTLDNVANELLGIGKYDLDWEELTALWEQKRDLHVIAEYCLKDSELTLALGDQLLPNVFALSQLVNNIPSDTSRGTYGQLVENYALKKAVGYNTIVPNKPNEEEMSDRLKADAIEGAFVLQPKPGLHTNVAVFDFRSLYPTIIVSHNIDPSTFLVECEEEQKIKVPGTNYFFCKEPRGFVPDVLEGLINARTPLKKLLKTLDKKSWAYRDVNARQFAIKTVANSFYGYLAFAGSRWYRRECAESVTAFGRFYIHNVIDMAKQHGFEVIYGDTDSIFLKREHDLENASLAFLTEVNGKLPGIMELDYQGTYISGIFVAKQDGTGGVKKKYALMDEEGGLTIRGFERVRRDWSQLARDTQEKVLRLVLTGKKDEAISYVKGIVKDLKSGSVPLEQLGIYTAMKRAIGSYENKGPHVTAAEKAIKRGRKVHTGEVIQYVITKGNGKISDKAELLEFAKNYDPEYYINNQILPAALRALSVFGLTEEDFLGKGKQSGLGRFFTGTA